MTNDEIEKAKENSKRAHIKSYYKYVPKKDATKAVLLMNLNTTEIERFGSVKEVIDKLGLWKDHLLEGMAPQLKKKGYQLFGYENDILAEVEDE